MTSSLLDDIVGELKQENECRNRINCLYSLLDNYGITVYDVDIYELSNLICRSFDYNECVELAKILKKCISEVRSGFYIDEWKILLQALERCIVSKVVELEVEKDSIRIRQGETASLSFKVKSIADRKSTIWLEIKGERGVRILGKNKYFEVQVPPNRDYKVKFTADSNGAIMIEYGVSKFTRGKTKKIYVYV